MKKKKHLKPITFDNKSYRDYTAAINRLLPTLRYKARELIIEYYNLTIELDDLIQEGALGVMRASDTFNPELGVKFETYASKVIDNAMTDHIRYLYPYYDYYSKHIGAYDEIEIESSDKKAHKHNDLRISQVPDYPYVAPVYYCIEKETMIEINTALNSISERESMYLKYRYGFMDDTLHNQDEAAKHFHLSKSRGRSIEKLALDNCMLELPWWYSSRPIKNDIKSKV